MSMLESAISRPLVDVDLGELAAVSAELERKPASAAVQWAWERFGTGVVLAADELSRLDDVSRLRAEYPDWMLARQGEVRRKQMAEAQRPPVSR